MSDDLKALQAFSGIARLFPLPNVVLFPHMVLPLHIFEPRYRQMMGDALAGDQLIAITLLPAGNRITKVGLPFIPSAVSDKSSITSVSQTVDSISTSAAWAASALSRKSTATGSIAVPRWNCSRNEPQPPMRTNRFAPTYLKSCLLGANRMARPPRYFPRSFKATCLSG